MVILILFYEVAAFFLVVISWLFFIPQFWSLEFKQLISCIKKLNVLLKIQVVSFTFLIAIPNKVFINNGVRNYKFLLWSLVLIGFANYSTPAAFLYISLQVMILESYLIGKFFHSDVFINHVSKLFESTFVDSYIDYFYGNPAKAAYEKAKVGLAAGAGKLLSDKLYEAEEKLASAQSELQVARGMLQKDALPMSIESQNELQQKFKDQILKEMTLHRFEEKVRADVDKLWGGVKESVSKGSSDV